MHDGSLADQTADFDRLRRALQQADNLPLVPRMVFGGLYRLSAVLRRMFGWRVGRLLLPTIHRRFGYSLRFFVSGGAKLDPEVAERLLNLGFRVLEGYGLTETAPVISFTPLTRAPIGSVGLPIEGVEIRIDNPDEKGIGEVLTRGH